MSIVRVGTTKQYADNWDNIFGGASRATTRKKAAKATLKKKSAKKKIAAKPGKKARTKK
jgi:RNA-splicing ligase RtcB